jgi:hypothetical protein
MATVRQNLVIEGLSGLLGDQLVFKRDRAGRTIVSRKPNFENRVFSESQKRHQSRFQEAAAYAKTAAKTEPIYAKLAAGTIKSAYNVAVADWFNPPEVSEIDVRGYTGRAGETIRAKVTDDVRVERVDVVIAVDGDVVVEQGQMTHKQGLWYTYTTTADCPAGPTRVIVTGLDLPGHEGTNETASFIII